MDIETKWFGTMQVEEDKIISFENGLIGFEQNQKFTLIYDSEKGNQTSIIWLQSVDEPSLALPVMKPEIVKQDYDPIVEDELLLTLGEDIHSAQLLVLVTLTVPADLTKMTCNLKAPIIINIDTMNAIQLIADNSDYQVRYPIYDQLNNDRERNGESRC